VPTAETQVKPTVSEFGSNQDQTGALESSASTDTTATALTHEQKVQAIVDKMGTNIGTSPIRQQYKETVRGLPAEAEKMRSEGKSSEEIARAMHQRRIDIGKQYKGMTPAPLRAYILEVNMGRYGNNAYREWV
jgi:hypothetical protein